MGSIPQILDCTLRDGSYVIDFQFTAEDTALIVSGLDSAGVSYIEVGHGLGLGAARAGHGAQAASDAAYLAAARQAATNARVGAFFIPGIGHEEDLHLAVDHGIDFVRIGTNCTELANAERSIALSKGLGLEAFSNLMKSYAVTPEAFGDLAKQAEGYGADCVALVDSAGGMLPEDIKTYLEAAQSTCNVRLGFHGHDNLSMGVANALAAVEHGAAVVDGTLQGIGRSEGNTATEVLAAILERRGLLSGIDVNGLLDLSGAFVRPLLKRVGFSSLGVTTGRAKVHSSFIARVLESATQHGVDPRDLILRLSEHDQVDAPQDLLNQLAGDLAQEACPKMVRVDIAANTAETPGDFESQVRARVQELKEQGCKYNLPAVLNVVVTPYELTAVSPYVESRYGCCMTNIMLADSNLLDNVLEWAEGIAEYVLFDAGNAQESALNHTTLLPYSDHDMWARAAASHVNRLMDSPRDKTIAVTGVSALTDRTALLLRDLGAVVTNDLDGVLPDADAIISLSPRQPAVNADQVSRMKPGALLFDGGIGSLSRDSIPAAEARGVRVVRIDMRPTLAATALELIGMHILVKEHMGRADWDSVSVVAGGLIGTDGEVIVDSISAPTRIIGIADGKGGIRPADPQDETVLTVRRYIATKRLGG
jgi:4-hydroxy-2-oxovalerate aldolase